jgi:hypothetical protein
MKKRLIFLLCFSVSLLMNIIPLFVFKEKAAFNDYSLYPLVFMIVMSIQGLVDCSKLFRIGFRRRPHSFPGVSRLFGKSSEEENERAFFWQSIVYWVAIPFYLPCIFFSTKFEHLPWTLLVFFAPQIIYISYFLIYILIDAKKDKRTKQTHEQELKEQQKREEMGRFK